LFHRLADLATHRLEFFVGWPTKVAKFTAAGLSSNALSVSDIGNGEPPSGPPMTVVTPWRIWFSASGQRNMPSSGSLRIAWL
jgi:hypothetical protein